MGSLHRAMRLIGIAPSKQQQHSSFEATTIDGFTAHGSDSHRNRPFEATTAQPLRGNHNRWIHCTGLWFSSKSPLRSSHSATPSRQPQSMDSLHRAMILMEIAPSKQPQRSSFEATAVDGFTAQGNDSHRIAPAKQPQRSSFEATPIDGFTAQGSDSHRNRSFGNSATPSRQPQ